MKDRRDWEMHKALMRRITGMRYVWVYGEVQVEKYSEIEVTATEQGHMPGVSHFTLAMLPAESPGELYWDGVLMRDGHLGVTDEVAL